MHDKVSVSDLVNSADVDLQLYPELYRKHSDVIDRIVLAADNMVRKELNRLEGELKVNVKNPIAFILSDDAKNGTSGEELYSKIETIANRTGATRLVSKIVINNFIVKGFDIKEYSIHDRVGKKDIDRFSPEYNKYQQRKNSTGIGIFGPYRKLYDYDGNPILIPFLSFEFVLKLRPYDKKPVRPPFSVNIPYNSATMEFRNDNLLNEKYHETAVAIGRYNEIRMFVVGELVKNIDEAIKIASESDNQEISIPIQDSLVYLYKKSGDLRFSQCLDACRLSKAAAKNICDLISLDYENRGFSTTTFWHKNFECGSLEVRVSWNKHKVRKSLKKAFGFYVLKRRRTSKEVKIISLT